MSLESIISYIAAADLQPQSQRVLPVPLMIVWSSPAETPDQSHPLLSAHDAYTQHTPHLTYTRINTMREGGGGGEALKLSVQ